MFLTYRDDYKPLQWEWGLGNWIHSSIPQKGRFGDKTKKKRKFP